MFTFTSQYLGLVKRFQPKGQISLGPLQVPSFPAFLCHP